MKFMEFVAVSAMKAELGATDKESVVSEMVDALVAASQLRGDDRDDIIRAIMKREQLGSTGIGRGIAVPHTKHPSVDRLIGTVGISVPGVDFDSLD
ncbi:MAG: PTS sugar transporter subunit IIA, partial [Pirellulaceae bacterium]